MGLRYDNDRVKRLRSLIARRRARSEHGLFVIEGPVLVAEAVAAGVEMVEQFVAAGGADAAIDGAGTVHELAPGVLERVADTQHPQAPIAVAATPVVDSDEVLARSDLVIALDRVSDPGNLGTILRSAEAAGLDAVVLTPGSVDPTNPKVVRASAGALFHVPVLDASLEAVSDAGFELFGTSSRTVPGRRVVDYTDADLTGRCALVMGNEAAGLPDEWNDDVGPIAQWLTIEHRGRSESLNVAMAATILVFEAARQRHSQQSGPGPICPKL